MIICSFSDPDDYKIFVEGACYRFDFSERFGPLFLNTDGTERKRQPGRQVSEAISAWFRQGKRIDDDGVCLYRLPNLHANYTMIGGCKVLLPLTRTGKSA